VENGETLVKARSHRWGWI